jgi:putative sigma-54 modulation protein
MDIIVTGKHVEITDAIRDYARSKVQKLPRYYDRVAEIEVLITKPDNHEFEVEIIAHVDHHDNFVARHRHQDLYGCIDDVTDKMTRQLKDHKERLRNRKHQAHQ